MVSLYYLIRLRQQRRRDREAQRLGGLAVDDQLELRGLLDGQVGGLGAFEEAPVPSKNSSVGLILRCANGSAIWLVMLRWLVILFGTLRSTVRTQSELALENLALRQQLAMWKARHPRRG